MITIRAFGAALAVSALLACSGSVAMAAESFSFSNGAPGQPGYLGPCHTASVVVTVDAAVVPPPFVALAVGNRALAVLASLDCPTGIDGAAPQPARAAELNVFILPPDGTLGLHQYQASLIGTDAAMQSRLQDLGMGAMAETVSPLTFTRTPGLLTRVTSSVPWSAGAFTLDAHVSQPLSLPLPQLAATTWHKGKRGIIRMRFTNDRVAAGAGVGSLAVQPSSQLAQWLGGSAISGAAAMLVADVAARIDLCGAAIADCPNGDS
ncbi:MAG TPA: hypothetical protein VFZ89_02290 [Solirubrobacteraceae bacterium]